MAAPAPRRDDAPEPSFADLLAQRPALSTDALAGLMMEEVPLARIAQAVGTPTWVYSAGTLRRRARALCDALREAGLDATVHFATKSNPNLAVVALLAGEGLGADVVSEGELRAARAAGVPASGIVFSGVGKTEREMRLAIAEDILQLNLESAEEAEMLDALARSLGRRARVALRVNPDVDARTHAKITTGLTENKFGVPIALAPALYARLCAMEGLEVVGLATHIGSQITQGVSSYAAAYARLGSLVRELRAQGLPVERVDCGGGLGIPYRDEIPASPAALAGTIKAGLGDAGVKLMLEPGRWIAGPAGVLLSRVVIEKQSAGRRFVILDAAMNDLLRPAMYEAWHGILPVSPAAFHAPQTPADVVGPVCESSDTFAKGRNLPALPPASLVAFLDAGAYGASMSSTYNARPLAAEVMVNGSDWSVVRERQGYEQLLAGQRIPGWITRPGEAR
ncbi:diaminopimelate decarboxylase [Sabulicella glaciei]|uniref:Diaminopimelate decarboxylase n=1 Tax=Sabulicella glaciei TaxID=2984948 RepID=A0ABT3P051_9PROT|nr:diaminopimelate decarboxylase [Roseococcus sp. MDT2-1-1]MCW8087799.1 diaminopimelate decarboxylase [Roseococcus sp. MDT2-1-1]